MEVKNIFSKYLAVKKLKTLGCTSVVEKNSYHFCKTIMDKKLFSTKITGYDEKENEVGSYIVCENCGDIH